MLASRSRWALLALLIASGGGCNKAWRVETMTPPIFLGSTLDARTSLPAVITVRDMEMPRFVSLPNSVYFVAVSKDRLRFHVTLHHKWEDMTDPTRWRVWIEDDTGRRYDPVGVDRRSVRSVTRSYSVPGTNHDAALTDTGEAIGVHPVYSISVYKGDGDYVFYRRGLVRRNMRSLTLVMQRPGYEYRYRWRFVDDEDDSLPYRAQESMAHSGRCVGPRSKCGPIVASPLR